MPARGGGDVRRRRAEGESLAEGGRCGKGLIRVVLDGSGLRRGLSGTSLIRYPWVAAATFVRLRVCRSAAGSSTVGPMRDCISGMGEGPDPLDFLHTYLRILLQQQLPRARRTMTPRHSVRSALRTLAHAQAALLGARSTIIVWALMFSAMHRLLDGVGRSPSCKATL